MAPTAASDSRGAGGRSDTTTVARGRLARDLVREVRGDVRFDDAARGAYATDASVYRQVPIGVVPPATRMTWPPRWPCAG
ncbi:hypothetical protein SAMN05216207_106819 [Pseudonocardia ammonioxydans]|uniref:Uncharacterized protein n=1 Tax=Pseudonocardia ammonioxydans TaxID=260086 RepID=A0A1I5HL63_PSUAM|nr:hypothetical protein [Pseudonocardia ammonioxydans]SFO49042.1 hypothetical protein SAMN05216207_106819 [Pseudonocardia ammonioxydans]